MTEFFNLEKFQKKAKRLRWIILIILFLGYTLACLGVGVLASTHFPDPERVDLFWKTSVIVGGIFLFFGFVLWRAARPFFKPPKQI